MCTTEEQNKASGEELLNSRQAANDSVAEQFADFFNPELLKERPDSPQAAEYFTPHQLTRRLDAQTKEKLKQYYLQQARMLCPNLSADSPDEQCLWRLYNKLKRTVKALANFDRTWETGMREIEKACLYYLITQEITRADRQEIIKEFSTWIDFVVNASFNRNIISQTIQHYCRQIRNLEYYYGCKSALTGEEEEEDPMESGSR